MGSIIEHDVPRAARAVPAMAMGSSGPGDRASAGVGSWTRASMSVVVVGSD